MLGTGRLTIARAIGHIFFGGGTRLGKMNLEIFSEEKKKCQDVRTHAHSFNSAVPLLLAHGDTAKEVRLNHFFMLQLFLVFPFS